MHQNIQDKIDTTILVISVSPWLSHRVLQCIELTENYIYH